MTQDKPRGVETEGEGKRSTAHLNLTRSVADVDAEQASPIPPKPRKMGRPRGPNLIRPRYAGDERFEGNAA